MFITLLALKVTRLFEQRLHRVFGTTDDDPHALTLDDALTALSCITYLYYPIQGKTVARLPRPDAIQSALFSAPRHSLPQHRSQGFVGSNVYLPLSKVFHSVSCLTSLSRRSRRRKIRLSNEIEQVLLVGLDKHCDQNLAFSYFLT
ncbi:MAG: hypothetical protein ACREYF_19005 [Gammaproteobacteria bacterium]